MAKTFGVLALTAAAVVIAVLGLAGLTVAITPNFADGFAEATVGEDGSLTFGLTAVGGVIEITGDREGTVSLGEEFSGPSFGLSGDGARMFFSANPLTLDQMSYDGLEFFPDPQDCVFTVADHDPDDDLVAVHLECSLEDIRGNGAITLDGHTAMYPPMALDLDLPDTGGTVMVGEESWVIDHDPVMHVMPPPAVVGWEGNSLHLATTDYERSLRFDGDEEGAASLRLAFISTTDGEADVAPDVCSTTTRELLHVSTQVTYVELTFSCPDVQVPGRGEVPIEGTVVFSEQRPPPPPEG